jgi:orotate phosphoribosyltransferase
MPLLRDAVQDRRVPAFVIVMNRDIAGLLLKTKAVTFSAGKPFRWASGILSPVYTDNRVLLSYPVERRVVVDALVDEIMSECPKFDAVAGVATSGIPWASWVAEDVNKPLVYVRSRKKDHGKENIVEGRLQKGKSVVLIEDLVSTGGSSVAAVQAVRQAGAEISHCFAIFTYGLRESAQRFGEALCTLVPLTDFQTLVETAAETGYIGSAERMKIAEWLEDPKGWDYR